MEKMTDNNLKDKSSKGNEPPGTGATPSSYRDFSMECEQGQALDESFPVKLHYMLADIERDGADHLVAWHSHGRCFSVRNQSEFVMHVMPCYFRQSKFPSFQRQLNLYGFRRLAQGPDKGAYYHECFLRGKPFLATRIQRHRVKGTKRKPAAAEKEPDFFSMSRLPPSDMAKYGHQETNQQTQVKQTSERVDPAQFSLLADRILGRSATIRDDVLSVLTRNSIKPYNSSPLALSAAPLSAVAAINAAAIAKVAGLDQLRASSLAYQSASTSILVPSLNYDLVLAASTTARIRRLLQSSTQVTGPRPFTQTQSYFPNGI